MEKYFNDGDVSADELTAAFPKAIVAGTGINARLLKLDRTGTIAAKKEADFNVLDANPLDDIGNTRHISAVYLRGKEVDRKALKDRFMPPGAKK